VPIGELSADPRGPEEDEAGYGTAATCFNCYHPVSFHDIEEGDADGGRCQWPDCGCKAFR